jgi:hypothetical protein
MQLEKRMPAPIIPNIANDSDTSNFKKKPPHVGKPYPSDMDAKWCEEF